MTRQLLEKNIFTFIRKDMSSDYFRPFEAEIFSLLEKRRERMDIHPVTLYTQALNKEPEAAYRHHKRLRDTHSGAADTTSKRSTLTLEDAVRIARYLQIDLSDIVRHAEENLGYSAKAFPRVEENHPHKKSA